MIHFFGGSYKPSYYIWNQHVYYSGYVKFMLHLKTFGLVTFVAWVVKQNWNSRIYMKEKRKWYWEWFHRLTGQFGMRWWSSGCRILIVRSCPLPWNKIYKLANPNIAGILDADAAWDGGGVNVPALKKRNFSS